MMKRTGIWIVVLLIVGVIGFAAIEGYVKPELSKQAEQYEIDQNDPLTHDIQPSLAFTSQYMGDAGNLINLNASLPFRNTSRTFQLYPEELTAEIRYQAAPSELNRQKLEEILLYNATANFVMIDNLQKLRFVFEDDTVFVVEREEVEAWYDTEQGLASLRNSEDWEEHVRARLGDADYVQRFAELVIHQDDI